MIQMLFTVYDKVAQSFMAPFTSPSEPVFMRSITDSLSPESPYVKHPGDYAVYKLGTIDSETGEITRIFPPKHLCEIQDLVEYKEGDQ